MSSPTDDYDDERWSEIARELARQIQHFQTALDDAELAQYDEHKLQHLADELNGQYDAMQGLITSLHKQNSIWYDPYLTIAGKLIDARGSALDAKVVSEPAEKQSHVAWARHHLGDALTAANTY